MRLRARKSLTSWEVADHSVPATRMPSKGMGTVACQSASRSSRTGDSEADIEAIVELAAGIDPLMPFHISRYFPHFKYRSPATPITTLEKATEIARRKLAYVYPGNYINNTDTNCPGCGRVLIKRGVGGRSSADLMDRGGREAAAFR